MITITNKELIKKLILAGLNEGATFVNVRDTESTVINSRNPDKIVAEIDGGDEEIGLNFVRRNDDETKTVIGWIGLLPYAVKEEMVSDCTDNDFCKKVLAAAGLE